MTPKPFKNLSRHSRERNSVTKRKCDQGNERRPQVWEDLEVHAWPIELTRNKTFPLDTRGAPLFPFEKPQLEYRVKEKRKETTASNFHRFFSSPPTLTLHKVRAFVPTDEYNTHSHRSTSMGIINTLYSITLWCHRIVARQPRRFF